jgi:probable O-glycosylation ligase (exosortase A-associated)
MSPTPESPPLPGRDAERRASANPWRFREIAPLEVRPSAIVLIAACATAIVTAQIVLQYPPRVALVLAMCLIGGATVLLQPFLGILAYVVLAFLRPQEVFWGLGAERLTLIVSVVTLVAALLHFLRRPSLAFLPRPQNVLVLTLWLSIWLSTQFGRFATPNPFWMEYYVKLFVTYFTVLAVVDSLGKLQGTVVVLALSLGYLCWWANEMYFFQGWHTVHGPGGPGGTFHDHNDFAMVLVMVIPLLWFLARLMPHPLLGWGLRGIIPFAVHGVMVTYSRGGFLGMALVLLFCAIRERSRWLGGLLLAGGVFFFVAYTGEEYRDRIRSIVAFDEDASAQGRFGAWEAGRAMVADNPVFGVGLKQYLRAFPYYSTKGEFVAHNSWVQLAAECGLPALASWAGLIGLTGWSLVRVMRRRSRLPAEEARRCEALANAIGGSLLGYVFCGLLLSAEDLEFFYFLVAMAGILDRLTAERAREAGARPGVA